MQTSSDTATAFFFPFAPVPSTSDSIHSSAAGASPTPPPQPFTGTFGGKRLSCLTCRKSKSKCVWIEGVDSCSLCLKRALVCPGSTAPQRKAKSTASTTSSLAASPAAIDWDRLGLAAGSASSSAGTASVHSSTSTHASALVPHPQLSPSPAQSYSIAASAFSPYHTSVGRPRVLGPSSGEASLNALARAHILKGELIALYTTLWPLQISGWPTDTFTSLLTNRGSDGASRAMASIAAASGARSSSHSEVVGLVGPSIHEVDDDPAGQLTPGGFSEWGVRRHGACVAMAHKAIQETMTLLQRDPSTKSLKVALAGVTLYNGLFNDRQISRPFLVLVIETWRRVRNDALTTAEDQEWLVAKAGPVLLTRDAYWSINVGGPLGFTEDECSEILETLEGTLGLNCMGIPAFPDDGSLVVVDETLVNSAFTNAELSLLISVVHIFGNGSSAPFDNFSFASLRAFQHLVDRMKEPIAARLEALLRTERERVFVLHDWTGSWRPACMKQHAIILVNEIVQDFNELDGLIYHRLQLELSLGRVKLEPGARAELVATCRARCRYALKMLARSIHHFNPTHRKHASYSNMMTHLVALEGWTALILARYGEPGGPATKEDELTLDELEWLVRAFRLGSYSQSALMVPLRELEAGLTALRMLVGESVEDSLSAELGGW